MAEQQDRPAEREKSAEQSLPASAQASYEQGRQKAQQMQDEFVTSIRQQPLRAVLFAAAVGILVGVLWERR